MQQITNDSDNSDQESFRQGYETNLIINKGSRKDMVNATINGCNIKMEVDTGAPCGIISKATFDQMKYTGSLQRTSRQFTSYTDHRIPCVGRAP